jgi:hypothetical protein
MYTHWKKNQTNYIECKMFFCARRKKSVSMPLPRPVKLQKLPTKRLRSIQGVQKQQQRSNNK